MKDGEEALSSEPQGHVETFELVEEEEPISMFPIQNVSSSQCNSPSLCVLPPKFPS